MVVFAPERATELDLGELAVEILIVPNQCETIKTVWSGNVIVSARVHFSVDRYRGASV